MCSLVLHARCQSRLTHIGVAVFCFLAICGSNERRADRGVTIRPQGPGIGQVIETHPSRPYLCLRLDVAKDRLAELAAECMAEAVESDPGSGACPGLWLGETTADVLSATDRLARLMDATDDVPFLAPLYERELLYRVMRTPAGQMAVRTVQGLGRDAQVARAIAWLRQNRRDPFKMKVLIDVTGLQHSAPTGRGQRFAYQRTWAAQKAIKPVSLDTKQSATTSRGSTRTVGTRRSRGTARTGRLQDRLCHPQRPLKRPPRMPRTRRRPVVPCSSLITALATAPPRLLDCRPVLRREVERETRPPA